MRLLAALLLAVSSAALAAEPAPAPPVIDPAPFKKAVEDYVEAKLRGELVEKSVERARRSKKLAEKGIPSRLLDDLCAQHDKAAEWVMLLQQATRGEPHKHPLLEQLPTQEIPAERESGLRQKLLDEGVEPGLVTQVIEAGNAVRRLGALWQRVEAAITGLAAPQGGPPPVRLDEVRDLLSPPAPSQVTVEAFEGLAPKGTRAEAEACIVTVRTGDRAATGRWEKVRFEFDIEKRTWHVAKDVELRIPAPTFGPVNYTVVALYLVGMLAIGWWTSRRISGTRGFFIAEGKLNHIVVGISLMTAYLSALTMMALSGVAFCKADMTWSIQLPFLVVTAFVITRFVLKRYRDAGVVSVYEYLEQRIHVSSRLLASFCFILFSIGRMGLVLFLPALAFHIITGADLLVTIVVMGAVVTVYTVMGGIEAVIWTDLVQGIVILVGALVSVAYVVGGTGAADFAQLAREHHKFRMLAPGFDITKLLTVWLILQTIFETIRIYGTQQDMTQRYMTTSSTRKANQSVWIAILAYIPLGYLFYFIGASLFVYYQAHPDPAVPALIANGRTDAIYPYFVASKLPPGLAGLVIAAIFAAAMSSIDACMNASSTVCVEDFYRRFRRKDLDDRHHLNVARWLTLVWGVLAIAMAISFMDIRYAQHVWSKIMGISTNGVLGLMALAFLPWRVHKVAAAVGFVVSYLCLFLVMWFLEVTPAVAVTFPNFAAGGRTVHWLLWPVIGNTVCFGLAVLLDLTLFRARRP